LQQSVDRNDKVIKCHQMLMEHW